MSIAPEAGCQAGFHEITQLSRPPGDFVIPNTLRLPLAGFRDPCAEGVASLLVKEAQRIGVWIALSISVLENRAVNERRKVIDSDEDDGGVMFLDHGAQVALHAGLDWLARHHLVTITADDVVHPTELLVTRLGWYLKDAA